MGISHRPEQPRVKFGLRKGAPLFAAPTPIPVAPKTPQSTHSVTRPHGPHGRLLRVRPAFLQRHRVGLPVPPRPRPALPAWTAARARPRSASREKRSHCTISARASGAVPVGNAPGRGTSLAALVLARRLGTVNLQLVPPMGPESAQNSLRPPRSKRLHAAETPARSRPCVLRIPPRALLSGRVHPVHFRTGPQGPLSTPETPALRPGRRL